MRKNYIKYGLIALAAAPSVPTAIDTFNGATQFAVDPQINRSMDGGWGHETTLAGMAGAMAILQNIQNDMKQESQSTATSFACNLMGFEPGTGGNNACSYLTNLTGTPGALVGWLVSVPAVPIVRATHNPDVA